MKTAINPIAERLQGLRNEMVYSALAGQYKNFKNASKEHAKLAVNNFKLSQQVKTPPIKVPLFSKYGLRMAKVYLLNLFRIKSPEEKLLKNMAEKERAKQVFKI